MLTQEEINRIENLLYECLMTNRRVVIELHERRYYLHAISQYSITLVGMSAVYSNSVEMFLREETLEPDEAHIFVFDLEKEFILLEQQLEQPNKVKVKPIELVPSNSDRVEMFLVEEGMPRPSDSTGKVFYYVIDHYEYL